MVKIDYSPTTSLVVHDVVKMDYDDLVRERVTPNGVMPLYWGNGILFGFSPLPVASKRMLDEYLQGKVHWMEVHYSHKKDYEQIITLSDEQFPAPIKVRVIDVSKRALFKEFVEWLKTNQAKQ
jgi:hypothetical protein